jgi:putative phosphonate metabolism protein
MRAAVYFTPREDEPLSRAASAWLGRNAFTGEVSPCGQDDRIDISRITSEPRHYGFHATIKAPFRLAPGRTLDGLERAMAEFCAATDAFTLPGLALQRIGSFFALVPRSANDRLNALANAVVTAFDPFRAALNEDELARRREARLSAAQARYLERWGYPYVFDEYRFHMSLTGPVAPDDYATVLDRLEMHFSGFVNRPLVIDALSLFCQPRPGADFTVHARYPLSAGRPQ